MKTMASPGIVFYLSCLFLGKMVLMSDHKEEGEETQFILADVGEEVTLQCFYDHEVTTRIYWYKQTLGKKPRLISAFFTYNVNKTLYNEFRDNPRFTLDTKDHKNHLTITDLHISDSAMYHCIYYLYTLEFSESVSLNVKSSSSNIKASVHQSASETIQPGGSVTLNCTVHTGTCDGGHSVYWFRNQEDEESPPGLIYTHGGRSDQCERKPDTQTHTCVYNLPMKSLNLSHAGTYYCAVASCGRILFGNGTKLDFQDEVDWVAFFWRGAFAFNFILSVLLAFSICMMNKRSSCLSAESEAGSSLPTKGNQLAENIYYAALSVNLTKRWRRQRDPTWSECVYHSIKQ